MPMVEPLAAEDLSREAIARRDLGHTAAGPATVGVLLGCFLFLIAAVAVAELSAARTPRVDAGGTAWSPDCAFWIQPLRKGPGGPIAHRALTQAAGADCDEPMARRRQRARVSGPGGLAVLPSGCRVHHATRICIASAPEWTTPPQPDPRPAIAQLKRDLDARGIALIVMPTPLKPVVHPEMLAERYASLDRTLHNPSYERLVADLRRDGVVVFDPSDTLAAGRRSGPQYLASDTHWRPEAMEAVAASLAEFMMMTMRPPLAGGADYGYLVERLEVRGVGDTARMLDLPEGATLFAPETVWLRRILQPDRSQWRPSRAASVLLLGDSFSNIYALDSMGWGTSAGFAEQLSYSLGVPIDRLLQNDQGAFATRALLQQEAERLNGKRVVIYQFAVRELVDGDWRILPLPRPE
jgi:hypothetical protein